MTPSVKLEMRRSAEFLAREGRHSEACEILEKLVRQSPKNPLIWNELGIQYEAAGQIDMAFASLKRGHAVDSSYPPTLYNLGKFTLDHYARLQETEGTSRKSDHLLLEAIRYLNANLDRDPDNADGHTLLAMAYALSGDKDKALMHVQISHRLTASTKVPLPWMKKSTGTV